MAIKDVQDYYDAMCEQYHEMIETLHEFEKDCENNLISPEDLERVKANVEPIKNNWQRLTYIMFLLNQPKRKEKVKKYAKESKKLLSQISNDNTKAGVIAENNVYINKLRGR